MNDLNFKYLLLVVPDYQYNSFIDLIRGKVKSMPRQDRHQIQLYGFDNEEDIEQCLRNKEWKTMDETD